MNLLDILLLLGLALAAFRGFRRGALAQVAGLGGAVLGLIGGARFAPSIAAMFVTGPGVGLALLTLAVLLGFVFLGQGLGFAVGSRLRAAAAGVGAAPVDRTAGVAVGIGGVLITVWLLAATFAQGPFPGVAQQVRDSRVVGAIAEAMPPPPDVFGRVGAYLDRQGFPQVFSGIGGGTTAPPVDPPEQGAVAAAAEAGSASIVQVEATGCGGISFGSGFVTRPGYVVTNAHVIAGGGSITVRDQQGSRDATPIHFDPDVDLAVLSVPDLASPGVAWAAEPVRRGTAGATLGFPGGQRSLVVEPAAVRGRGRAVGRDIYGGGAVTREIITLSADVERGDSGGPFVTRRGRVGGVLFAAAAAEPDTAYALTAESVRPAVQRAITREGTVGTGSCRF